MKLDELHAQVDAAIEWWQEMFRMRDWKITVRWTDRAQDMVEPNDLGNCVPDVVHRSLLIILLEPDRTSEPHKLWGDTESTRPLMVAAHEFIHGCLWMVNSPSEDVANKAVEQAIDTLAYGLFKMTQAHFNWD